MRHVTKLTAALAIGVLLAVGTAIPAMASTPPPSTRTAPIAGTVKWGVPIAALGSCSVAVPVAERGGWSKRLFVSTGAEDGSYTSSTVFRSVSMTLSEPCQGSGNTQPKVAYQERSNAYSSNAGSVSARIGVGVGQGGTTTTDYYIKCQTTEWSATQTTRYASSGGFLVIDQIPTNSSYIGGGDVNGRGPDFTGSGCNFLVSVNYTVCTWSGWTAASKSCVGINWSAERWFANTVYGDDADGDGEGALIQICEQQPSHPDCVYVNPPGGINGADMDVVCAYAPIFTSPDWGTFDQWIPRLVQWWEDTFRHYARCLFVPVNGFDREGKVAASWEGSSANAVVAPLITAGESLSVGESCGVIVPGGWGIMPSFSIDSCSWSWAGQIKTVLALAVGLIGAIFILRFVVNTITGVLNRKTPSPLGGD
jgi:hypothetical protein